LPVDGEGHQLLQLCLELLYYGWSQAIQQGTLEGVYNKPLPVRLLGPALVDHLSAKLLQPTICKVLQARGNYILSLFILMEIMIAIMIGLF
jgi:hypothetical protein